MKKAFSLFLLLMFVWLSYAQTVEKDTIGNPTRGGDFYCSGVVVSGNTATVTLCADDYEPIVALQGHPTSFDAFLQAGLYYDFDGWVALENIQNVDSVIIREVDTNWNTVARVAKFNGLGVNNTTVHFSHQSTTGRFVFDIYCYYGAVNNNSGFEITIIPTAPTILGNACVSSLGVCTNSPQKQLHVNGEMRVSNSSISSSYMDIKPTNAFINLNSNNNIPFYFNNKIISTKGFYSYYHDLALGTDNTQQMTILRSNGNVGIGTTAPTQKLDVNGKMFLRNVDSEQGWGNCYLYWQGHSLVMGTPPGAPAHNSLDLKPGGTTAITEPLFSRLRMFTATSTNVQTQKVEVNTEGSCWFVNEGNFGIGTTAPAYKLDVAGEIRSDSIRTQAITVQAVSGADFVFDKDYKLPSLNDVQTYIQSNGHLPDIKSAEEMLKNGVNISEFQIQLLQKIEELTLYIIKQEERIKKLETINFK